VSSFFPRDEKKIRERIRRYERALEREVRLGCVGDGYGKRFLLGPLYMLAGDVDGALRSFEWFEATFPDSGGDGWQYLAWALALYRARRWRPAFVKLYQAILQNRYLVARLIGEDPRAMKPCRESDVLLDDALETPPELLAMWHPDERAWARHVWEHPAVVKRRERYLQIERTLDRLPRGPRRNALVKELMGLERSELDPEMGPGKGDQDPEKERSG